MKGIFKINGQEIEIEINEQQLEQLKVKPKKTGYERVEPCEVYYCPDGSGAVQYLAYNRVNYDKRAYENANYYSDKTVAENNARADNLMRKLRRFAVENRKEKIDWKNKEQLKWCIHKDQYSSELSIGCFKYYHDFGQIYFDSKETAEKAVERFRDELTWYFTEYKDSL